MAGAKVKSAAAIARESVNKLRSYIDKTSVADIPKNQFQKASRQRICKELGITYSTVGSNADLATLFDQLDTKIGAGKTEEKRPNSNEIRQLNARVSTLENRVASLKAENDSLRSQLKRYEHFEITGRMARP
ncbi:MAG: hypothetical protein JAZ17_11345 [Candidatus Thiodiazotropha endolucinida]|nr:hypothetical protein [Candidatus Thiodiazotropha taylori]MCG8094202.1 hypothetical protein [Candidatus Thiodiazotropha endolucinida]MCG8047668.1 hypothetical protein [Candidatus Thiodiazotropha taylori]MCG8053732.1 hypothetical protein [Candidatus Thiodiazotropha taylori]MCW4315552.1 hypothetical protein [Candidatus Thiodiazotropha taylori]